MIERSSVLKLRGLPFEATDNDIANFFVGFQLLHVHICRNNGKTTGEAFVQLRSDDEGYRARAMFDKKCLGKRYIEIFPAKPSEMKKRRGWESQITGFVVRMRGLPFNACQFDIKQFFSGIPTAKNRDSIYMTFDANRRPTGEAFVEFPTQKDREEALKRDRNMIGHRYIELFPANKADVDRAVSQNRYNIQQGHSFLQGFLQSAAAVPPQQVHSLPSTENVTPKFNIAHALKGLNIEQSSSSSSTLQYDNGPCSPYSGNCTNISENSVENYFSIPAFPPPQPALQPQFQGLPAPPSLPRLPSNQLLSDFSSNFSQHEQDSVVNNALDGFDGMSLIDIEESLEAIHQQEIIIKQQLLRQLSHDYSSLPPQQVIAPSGGIQNVHNMAFPTSNQLNKCQSVPVSNPFQRNNSVSGQVPMAAMQRSFSIIQPPKAESPKRFVSGDISLNNLLSFQSTSPAFSPFP